MSLKPTIIWVIILWVLVSFPLFLIFLSLINMCLGLEFFGFIPFEIHSAVSLYLWSYWGGFSHYFFKCFFGTILLLIPSMTSITSTIDILCNAFGLWSSGGFFSSFLLKREYSLERIRKDKFYLSILKFTNFCLSSLFYYQVYSVSFPY